MGGWEAVKGFRQANVYMKGDERILNDGHFVSQELDTARESYQRKQVYQARGIDTAAVARLLIFPKSCGGGDNDENRIRTGLRVC
jgi:hypothetical protein